MDDCDGTLKFNALVSGGLEMDVVHSGPVGCTFGFGVEQLDGERRPNLIQPALDPAGR